MGSEGPLGRPARASLLNTRSVPKPKAGLVRFCETRCLLSEEGHLECKDIRGNAKI